MQRYTDQVTARFNMKEKMSKNENNIMPDKEIMEIFYKMIKLYDVDHRMDMASLTKLYRCEQ